MQASTQIIGRSTFTLTGDYHKFMMKIIKKYIKTKFMEVFYTMATVTKIDKDIAAAKSKIAELQKKIREFETKRVEAENLQIV